MIQILKGRFQHILFFLLILNGSQTVYAQLRINEFVASNATIIEDPDYQDDADWIEIYNGTSEEVNLKGFYITDNLNKPDKFEFKEDVFIPADAYVLIWADGMDNGVHCNFKLSADGEEIGLYDKNLNPMDTLTYTTQKTDVSQGRQWENPSLWAYFIESTPNAPNLTEFFEGLLFHFPHMEPLGGLFDSEISVQILNSQGGEIRYTLDGSEPDIHSELYTGPVNIDSTRILRARIFDGQQVRGPVVTQSYFIGNKYTQSELPLISIASNPDNFWDAASGIYVQDFKPDWEIPVNIEMFETSGTDRAEFNQRAGLKINGLYSWQLPQKMLGLYFRKRYGGGHLDYPVISNSFRSSYETFALRASGSDWSYTLFRDILGQQATRLNMDLDISSSRPCIVFFNGEYMGIHNIREKIDSDYIIGNHGLEEGSFDMVENQDYAEAGDLQNYQHLQDLLAADLSIQSNFDKVAEEMDLENFTDLVVTELAVANTSINHNVMAWKPKSGGKWKWIVMDLDRGFFNPSQHMIGFYLDQSVWPLEALFDNPDYRNYFGKRLADQLYTTFHPEQMNKLIDEQQGLIESEMPNHIQHWEGTTSSYGDAMPSMDYWLEEVCSLRSFVSARPQALLSDLENYGFDETAQLGLDVYPANGGKLSINELYIPGTSWNGPYPKNLPFQLIAQENPGFEFRGWRESEQKVILPKGAVWTYLDDGSNQGADWIQQDFDDSQWAEGPAQLGYGDGDENTELSFGDDSQNKYISYYFRHEFMLPDSLEQATSSYTLNLLRDDGAIVYLNGREIIRDNIPCGDIDYLTPAITYVGGASESDFYSFVIDRSQVQSGNNLLAVEIHQSSGNSSDISFDLELIANLNTKEEFVSTDNRISLSLSQDRNLIADFEPTNSCLIPPVIEGEQILYKSCSPYLAQGDINILEEGELIIEEGVEIYMPAGANIFVFGKLEAKGSADERIVIKLNPDDGNSSWGAINFENTSQASHLSYVNIENASKGPTPLLKAAINAFNAHLELDHMIIEKVNAEPIAGRYSNISLLNSKLYSSTGGDLINVKYGNASIDNCTFIGNMLEDVDAIDFDDVDNGVIKNCFISSFTGLNNDGIDIGERSSNVLIDSVLIHKVFDKGISVGQASQVTVKNTVMVQCDMGLGIKDSSTVTVDHCIFYSTAYPVRCYEKNPGRAGGNAVISNSILSNSSKSSFEADSKSSIELVYSLSDNDKLPDNGTNLLTDPEFVSPTYYDFRLTEGSPCLGSGNDDGQSSDLGTLMKHLAPEPAITISEIFINSPEDDQPEFIALYNPSTQVRDLSYYRIDKGFTCNLPFGTVLEPGEKLYLTNDAMHSSWPSDIDVIEWKDGKLSNNGEQIQLLDASGIVLDYINYANDGDWPSAAFTEGQILVLKQVGFDNHFPGNWLSLPFNQVLDTYDPVDSGIKVFPNPTFDIVRLSAPGFALTPVDIYSLNGQFLQRKWLDENGELRTDLLKFGHKVLILHIGDQTVKVLLN